MPNLPLYVLLTRTMTVCAIGIFLSFPLLGQDSHPNDYVRSTRPLKSGGSITSLISKGQKRSWVNQPDSTPTPRVASRERGSEQNRSSASTSFYRQAPTNNAATGSYPYPDAASSTTSNSANETSRFENQQQAQLRYERTAVRDRSTGDLGNNSSSESLPATFGRRAAATAPAARVAQSPAGSQSRNSNSVVNPNATAAAFNSGPNYVNPNLNFAGYQGYQPYAVPASSVPALNTSARVAKNCRCDCPPPLQPQSFQPVAANAQSPSFGNAGAGAPQAQGYQFQPNIGVPQLGGDTVGGLGSGLFSWLRGTSRGAASNSLASLLPFRNLPPSTYLGQGLIGQPTAYVDGQPLRNLFRYISP